MSAAAMPWIVAAVSGAGAVYSAYAQKRAGDQQEAAARDALAISERQAVDAQERGLVAETQQRERARRLQAQQMATLAANGADVGSGSALDTLADTISMGELDALTAKNNAAREAWGIRMGGRNAYVAGMNEAAASRAGAFSTLLQGATTAYGNWKLAGGGVPRIKSPLSGGSSLLYKPGAFSGGYVGSSSIGGALTGSAAPKINWGF